MVDILIDQPTAEPTRKTSAAGIGGLVAVVVIWVAGLFWPDLEIPEEVLVALTGLVTFLSSYITKERSAL